MNYVRQWEVIITLEIPVCRFYELKTKCSRWKPETTFGASHLRHECVPMYGNISSIVFLPTFFCVYVVHVHLLHLGVTVGQGPVTPLPSSA